MGKIQEHWLAVGRVSNAAREQLAIAHCSVIDVQREPPIVLVCLRHQGDISKEWIWEYVEELGIPSSGLDVLIRSHDANNTVGLASVVDVEITTAAEVEAEERSGRVIELSERRRNKTSWKDFCGLEAGDDEE